MIDSDNNATEVKGNDSKTITKAKSASVESNKPTAANANPNVYDAVTGLKPAMSKAHVLLTNIFFLCLFKFKFILGNVLVESPSSGSRGEWCIALYDFQASEPTDLDLKAGDKIWVTEAVDDWWKGTCNGRSGIFPANYVQRFPDADVVKAGINLIFLKYFACFGNNREF